MKYTIIDAQQADDSFWVIIDPENGTDPFRASVETFEDAVQEITSYQHVRETMYPAPKNDFDEFN